MDNIFFLDNYVQEKNSGQYEVKKLQEYSRENILIIFKKFTQQTKNIYGYQKERFVKLLEGKDKDSFVLEVGGKPIGILAYKNTLQNEIPGISRQPGYIELKSIFLFDEFGKGNIWKLRKVFIDNIKNKFGNANGILVSVSKKKASLSFQMFLEMGFKELYEEYNKYNNGDNEVLLYYPMSDELEKNKVNITIRQIYFDDIINGYKTVEGRSGKSFCKMKKGDIIQFCCGNKIVKKEVKGIIKYKNVEDFLGNEGIENVLPGIESIEEGKKIYYSLPKYEEKIKKYGMIAFRF